MNLNQCYNILGLKNDATEQEVKKAYKKLAIKCHPDKNSSPDANEEFRKITEAYNKILNPHSVPDGNIDINEIFNSIFGEGGLAGMGSMGGLSGFGGLGDLNVMEELVEEIGGGLGGFGGMPNNIFKTIFGNNTNSNKGKDIQKLINLSLEDIYNGKIINVSYESLKINNESKLCNYCKGKGKIQEAQQMGPIVIQSFNHCSKCNGNGYIDLYLPYTETANIDIPVGFNYNEKMIVPDKGLPSINGRNGDLILSFSLSKHDKFKIKHNDLLLSIQITLKESLIGFTKEITHLDDRILSIDSVDIIKPNEIRCIENEGMYNCKTGDFGNLYLKFKIDYPNSLTQEQKDILIKYF